jgi:tetratricopeptide (TPR) repeat protein
VSNYSKAIWILIGFAFLICKTAKADSDPPNYLKLYTSSSDISKKLDAGYFLTRYYIRSNHDSAVLIGHECLDLSEKSGTDMEKGIALSGLGLVYFYSNEYDKSLNYYKQANDVFTDIDYKRGIGVNYSTMSVYYNRIGQDDIALELALKSLELLEKHGKGIDITSPLTTLGILYMRQGNYDRAKSYIQQALKAVPDSNKAANLLNNLGLIHIKKNDYRGAITYFERTLSSDSITGNLGGMSSTYTNLAVCYKNLHQYDTAMFYNLLSLKIDYQLSSKRGVAASMNNIGAVLLLKEDYQSAKDTFLKGLKITRELDDKGITSDLLANLSDAFVGLNQYDSALHYYKDYKALGDSLFNKERLSKIQKMEEDFENDRQTHKIALLDAKLRRKKQQNYFIIALGLALLTILLIVYSRFRTKQKLRMQMQKMEYEQKMMHLQMNPHFVFNALASISSYIGLREKDKAIRYLSKFAKLIRARLQQGREGVICLQDEIQNLKNYLDLEQIRLENPFEYSIEVSKDVNPLTEVPPTLIQPFLENAILHGFAHENVNYGLSVYVYLENGKVLAKIRDNGIGRTESEKKKNNSKTLHESLSTKIIQEYFTATRRYGKGLSFRIKDLNTEADGQTGTEVIIELCHIKQSK